MTGARSEPRWPNLIVPGTQKAGTTWLHYTLKRHPQVFMSSPKELFYWGQPGWDTSEAGREYRDHFAIGDDVENVADDVAYWGESTTNYLWHRDPASAYSPQDGVDAAAALGRTLGDEVVVLAMLRNPIDRALAGAQHHLTMDRIKSGDDLFDADPELGIIDLGFYRRHLEYWRSVLAPDRVRVYLFDDLEADPAALFERVLSDLQLEANRMPSSQWRMVNKVSNSRKELQERTGNTASLTVSEATIRRLADLYADDVAYVEELLGRNLDSWRVAS